MLSNLFKSKKTEPNENEKGLSQFLDYIHLSAIKIETQKIETIINNCEPVNDTKANLMLDTLCRLEDLNLKCSEEHKAFRTLPLDKKVNVFGKEHLFTLSKDDISNAVKSISAQSADFNITQSIPTPKELDRAGVEIIQNSNDAIFLSLTARLRENFIKDNGKELRKIEKAVIEISEVPQLKLVNKSKMSVS